MGQRTLSSLIGWLLNLIHPISFFQNVEIAMLGEITHLQPIVDDLTVLTEDPHKLPPASEQVTALIAIYPQSKNCKTTANIRSFSNSPSCCYNTP